jgi:hypothetical protein
MKAGPRGAHFSVIASRSAFGAVAAMTWLSPAVNSASP